MLEAAVALSHQPPSPEPQPDHGAASGEMLEKLLAEAYEYGFLVGDKQEHYEKDSDKAVQEILKKAGIVTPPPMPTMGPTA